MTPMQKYNFFIEPTQLGALRTIEERVGIPIAEQIRRAIQAYIESQTFVTKAELRKALEGK